jgi:hypothetical protein
VNRFIPVALTWLACGLVLCAGCARPVASNPRLSASNVNSLKKALGSGTAEAGPATPVAAAEPQGFSTLKGQFTLVGQPPERKPVSITKDPQICAPGGKVVLAEELVVDPNTKGIKDIVIYLVTKYPAGDPKWEHPDYAANANGQNEIPFDQKACVFLSHMYVMRSTQTLLIKNSDDAGHNTSINTSAGSKAQPFNELIPAFGQTTYKPVGESSIPNPVSCSIHPWMSALILTRNNPYYAVTKPDGTFEIKNVPAEVELEFAVWQQKSGYLGSVKVKQDGGAEQDETWKKGRFKRTLKENTPLDLNVTVDVAAFNK